MDRTDLRLKEWPGVAFDGGQGTWTPLQFMGTHPSPLPLQRPACGDPNYEAQVSQLPGGTLSPTSLNYHPPALPLGAGTCAP